MEFPRSTTITQFPAETDRNTPAEYTPSLIQCGKHNRRLHNSIKHWNVLRSADFEYMTGKYGGQARNSNLLVQCAVLNSKCMNWFILRDNRGDWKWCVANLECFNVWSSLICRVAAYMNKTMWYGILQIILISSWRKNVIFPLTLSSIPTSISLHISYCYGFENSMLKQKSWSRNQYFIKWTCKPKYAELSGNTVHRNKFIYSNYFSVDFGFQLLLVFLFTILRRIRIFRFKS